MVIDLEAKIREIEEHRALLDQLIQALKPQEKQEKIQRLQAETLKEDFWTRPTEAKEIQQEISRLNDSCHSLARLEAAYEDLLVLCEMVEEEPEQQLIQELVKSETLWLKQLGELEMETYFTDPMDTKEAILTLHAGAGGTEACDWVSMLFRMYQRWAEQHELSLKIYDSVDGEEAGYKSISFGVNGDYAYGRLKHEMGVHRLVRISPFDSSGRRHTSFASLEVLPQLDKDIQIDINPDDLRIDYYRSSGAGGQHVNKTSSAVRITHIPTNTVAACQNERSQIQNREAAMQLLKSKLYSLAKAKQLEHIEDLKGEQKDIAWGNQIRSYVFCPYTLVKDTRTGYQTSDIDAVMDGDIDPFILAMLIKASKEAEH
ncbi:MAG: peptide chain release factor 2 [Eubacteriales bacterium]|nr:peptide chain release factor 2 [Eubacteriales bacterium]